MRTTKCRGAVVAVWGCLLGAAAAPAALTPEVVPVIKDADLDVQMTKPATLVVKATGEVKSLGFTRPTLTRAVYATPPADGIQDYTLTAVPPDGVAGQAITEVTAEDAWAGYDVQAPWLKGVRIKGSGEGVKTLWLKADVVVDKDAAAGKMKAGQVVEVQTTYGVFPPFPADFAVTINGKPVQFNGYGGVIRLNGHPVVGASLYSYLFRVTEPGKQQVAVSFKRGAEKVEKVVELEVTK